MSVQSDLPYAVGRAAQLAAISSYFDVPVGPTSMPWHHERRADHDLLMHRTGPDFRRPGAFIAWARQRQAASEPLFVIDAVHGAERLRLKAPVELTLASYDRGQIELRVCDSVHAYLQWTARARSPARAGHLDHRGPS